MPSNAFTYKEIAFLWKCSEKTVKREVRRRCAVPIWFTGLVPLFSKEDVDRMEKERNAARIQRNPGAN